MARYPGFLAALPDPLASGRRFAAVVCLEHQQWSEDNSNPRQPNHLVGEEIRFLDPPSSAEEPEAGK